MSVQSLVPVAVEKRPLPQLYPAMVLEGSFGRATVCRLIDKDETHAHQHDYFTFRNKGSIRQRTAYHNKSSFTHRPGFRECGNMSSVKTNFKCSGTYDVDGELYIRIEEKGRYIDRFS